MCHDIKGSNEIKLEATGELAAPLRTSPLTDLASQSTGLPPTGAPEPSGTTRIFAVLGAKVPNPVPEDFGI